MKLNLYNINDRYIKYLRQFEEKIYENKEESRKHNRKYLGIVLIINEFNYYIPMSSPKKSDYIDFYNKVIRKDTKTIIRMNEGGRLYGTLRISNMIPVPIEEIKPYILSNEKDRKYREVILGELRYIASNTNKIIKYSNIVYSQKIKNLDIGYIKNVNNFKILEEKMKLWNTIQ